MYVINEPNGEEVVETFYEKKPQKVINPILNEKFLIIIAIIGLIRKMYYNDEQYFLQPYERFGGNLKVELYLSNYEIKVD